MDIRVHGKNTHIPDRLSELTRTKVGHVGRFFEGGVSADVEFEERHNPRLPDDRWAVEITSYAARQTVRVVASAQDETAALDLAVDKFERKLRRLKERLIQRNRGAGHKQLNTPSPRSDEEIYEAPRIVRTK